LDYFLVAFFAAFFAGAFLAAFLVAICLFSLVIRHRRYNSCIAANEGIDLRKFTVKEKMKESPFLFCAGGQR
jgi:hypothetical protein